MTNGNGRVADLLERSPEIKGHKTTRHKFHIASAEDAVEDRAHKDFRCKTTAAYGAFAVHCSRSRLPIISQDLAILVLLELLERHAGRRTVIQIPDLLVDGVIKRRVNLDIEFQRIRVLEKQRRLCRSIGERIPISVRRSKAWLAGWLVRLRNGVARVNGRGIRTLSISKCRK